MFLIFFITIDKFPAWLIFEINQSNIHFNENVRISKGINPCAFTKDPLFALDPTEVGWKVYSTPEPYLNWKLLHLQPLLIAQSSTNVWCPNNYYFNHCSLLVIYFQTKYSSIPQDTLPFSISKSLKIASGLLQTSRKI